MSDDTFHRKRTLLFVILACVFITNVLIAEFIGTKIFSLEATLGLNPANWNLLGIGTFSFNLTAGVLIWPVVFIMTDIINEYFGRKGVRTITFITAILLVYTFTVVYLAIKLVPSDSWITRQIGGESFNMDNAFNQVFGLGLWIIGASLIAFLLSQLIDAALFHWIKLRTGEKRVWLRATGSTFISQIFDSFVVLFIAFYISGQLGLKAVIALSIMSYIYKVSLAVVLTPLIYLAHYLIDGYLGKENAELLKKETIVQ